MSGPSGEQRGQVFGFSEFAGSFVDKQGEFNLANFEKPNTCPLFLLSSPKLTAFPTRTF
jgi:hypothetical protein